MILLFMHGWSFDANFWSALAALLPDWHAECDDRGYFGAPRAIDPGAPCIVIAHSFGAMRALSARPSKCKGLVAINGFDRFTASGDRPGVSPRIVERMIAKFDGGPATIVDDFRRRLGSEVRVGRPTPEPLREDLLALRDMDCTGESARWQYPILSLHGAQDTLLPSPMRDTAFSDAPRVERLTHPTGGHLLPVTDAPYCARAIRAFVEHAG